MRESLPVRGFDLHCHVDLFADPVATIARCERERIVTLAMTTTPLAWSQNRRWTDSSRYVHAAVGLHPELVGGRHAEVDLLEASILDAPFVGEIGLDGSPAHRAHYDEQVDVFQRALTVAQRVGGRIASIHSRRAGADVVRAIEQHSTRDRVMPILHWFSDSIAVARRAVEAGCYFSINQSMLQNASGISLVRSLPASTLLTETDAPFTLVDGRKSEPGDVVSTADHLARARDTPVDEMRRILLENTRRVFAFAGIETKFELHHS